MPSTYSSRLRLERIANGEQNSTWGDTTNKNIGTLIEQAIAAVTTIILADANYTLSANNGATDEARSAALVFTGALTAVRTVTAPSVQKLYVIKNSTTGGFAIQIKTSSGASVSISNGETTAVYTDGIDFFAVGVTKAQYDTLNSSVSTLTTTVGTLTNIVGLGGWKNKLINSSFMVNQRELTGTVILAAGAYGHDMWKAGASGCSYTFNTVNGLTTITITSGSLQQIIHSSNINPGINTMVLSWLGTSQGRINGGVYGASGVTASITGGNNVTIEFNTGTLATPQFELGSSPSQFEFRGKQFEYMQALAYFWRIKSTDGFYARGGTFLGGGTYSVLRIPYPVPMIATPTFGFTNATIITQLVGTQSITISPVSYTRVFSISNSATGADWYYILNAGYIDVSAEL